MLDGYAGAAVPISPLERRASESNAGDGRVVIARKNEDYPLLNISSVSNYGLITRYYMIIYGGLSADLMRLNAVAREIYRIMLFVETRIVLEASLLPEDCWTRS